MKKSLTIKLLVALLLVFTLSTYQAFAKENKVISKNISSRSDNLNNWMPDVKLQDAVLEVLIWKELVDDKTQITKELVKKHVDNLFIVDEIDDLKGLELAENLYGLTFELKNKTLNDYDLKPLGDNPNKENISMSTSQWEKSNIRNGDFKEGFKQVIEYDLRFSFEIFPIDHIFKVTKDTYKQFGVKTTSFYKPFSENKELNFSEDVVYDFDGKYLTYKISYNKDTDYIKFTLDEDQSDEIEYSEIDSYLEDFKPNSHVSLSDNKFWDSYPMDNVNLGGFFFFPKLRGVQPKPINVNYVDESNFELSDKEVINGIYGSTYTTTNKDIAGYTLTKLPDNATGTISDVEQFVTYIYKKNKPINSTSQVIVQYINMNGKKLSNDIILKGEVDEIYNTSEKKFKNYQLIEIPKNKTGFFTKQKQFVIYKYKAVNTKPHNLSKTGNDTGSILIIISLFSISFYSLKRFYQ